MLVITRKSGERICLGDEVTITVLDIVGSTVRLGIEAPAEVPVYRHEIATRTVQPQRRAQTSRNRAPAPSPTPR
jgi:carbon storage regulator